MVSFIVAEKMGFSPVRPSPINSGYPLFTLWEIASNFLLIQIPLLLTQNKNSIQTTRVQIEFSLAEKEGFEPSLRLTHTTPLAGEPLRPLGYFSINAEFIFYY